MKKIFMAIIAGSLSFNSFAKTPSNGEAPSYCEQIVSMHGLLSRAQLQCGFKKYNSELIEDSKKCFKHELGNEYGEEVLKFGLAEFDRNAKEVGKTKLCNDLLKAFPQYIAK